jgi:hypothetical protein
MTADDAVLHGLLSLWEQGRAAGRDMTAAELCRDRPELIPELERRIEALCRMSDLARTGGEKPSGGPADPHGTNYSPPPPDDLGVAQYRMGRYREAVATLVESEKLNAVAFQGSHPEDLAFLAMAQH